MVKSPELDDLSAPKSNTSNGICGSTATTCRGCVVNQGSTRRQGAGREREIGKIGQCRCSRGGRGHIGQRVPPPAEYPVPLISLLVVYAVVDALKLA